MSPNRNKLNQFFLKKRGVQNVEFFLFQLDIKRYENVYLKTLRFLFGKMCQILKLGNVQFTGNSVF